MNILIIGTGSMARGISTRLLAGSHALTLYNPDRAEAEALANELRSASGGSGSVAVTAADGLPEGIAGTDVVILASWYPVNLETARALSEQFDGKVVVDVSNPLNETYDGLVPEPGTSAAENIRDVLPAGAKVVKARVHDRLEAGSTERLMNA